MIDDPGIELVAEPSRDWTVDGPLAERVLHVSQTVRRQVDVQPVHFRILRAAGEHLGLGVGTQLGLAVAHAILTLAGEADVSLERLARITGRGLRSGIGLHGFRHGGFIVDGGRGPSGAIPPLVAHLAFPLEWSVLLVTPPRGPGLHGPEEVRAFANLPSIPARITDRLCRLVLLGLMPALIERDLDSFGTCLTEMQEQVGRCFAPAQGGSVASPEGAAIVRFLRAAGLKGVGQSSWGPTVYGVAVADHDARSVLAASVAAEFSLAPQSVRWTVASTAGAVSTRQA